MTLQVRRCVCGDTRYAHVTWSGLQPLRTHTRPAKPRQPAVFMYGMSQEQVVTSTKLGQRLCMRH